MSPALLVGRGVSCTCFCFPARSVFLRASSLPWYFDFHELGRTDMPFSDTDTVCRLLSCSLKSWDTRDGGEFVENRIMNNGRRSSELLPSTRDLAPGGVY